MATTKSAGYEPAVSDYSRQAQPMRETSVEAHYVRSIAVTMATGDMEALLNVLGRIQDDVYGHEAAVVREFIHSVQMLEP